MKKFLITGADFRNKGGQSMLFIAISELRNRFPDCQIYFPTSIESDKIYRITNVFYNYDSLYYMHGGVSRIKAIAKAILKRLLGKQGRLSQVKQLEKIFPELDGIIDISGYNLSSDWSEKINFKYLEFIRQAKKYDVPVYLMPQSFGPFDYGKRQKKMDKDIQELLSYCRVVFVREKKGYDELSKYNLKNVFLSPDLVLQNKNIKLENIFDVVPKIKVPSVSKESVAIIPNLKTVEHGDEEALYDLYKNIIEQLCKEGKVIYVLRHSSEDIIVCKKIKNMFLGNENVIILEEDFSCIEFSMLVEKFDFIIASRYHSLVHALKKNVPGIALGWAVKYYELFNLLDLSAYVFDVRNAVDAKKLMELVVFLCQSHQDISKKIESKMKYIQNDNCFDVVCGEIKS